MRGNTSITLERWASTWMVVLVCLAVVQPAPAGERVHFSDFDENIGEGWSTNKIERPPNPKRSKFLGRFAGNESARLTLEKLPEHAYLKLTFDLHVIQSWDGTNTSWGPDRWKLYVDQRVLLDTIFRNEEEQAGSLRGQQHYPALLPEARNKFKTGAAVTDRLGYKRTDGVKDTSPDATYKMSFVLPHTADTARIVFSGINLQEVGDESWGLENVTVEVLGADEVKPIGDEAWAGWWSALGSKNPGEAYHAGWAMIGHGDETVDRLSKVLLGPDTKRAAQRQRVKDLIEKLDDDSFAEREEATNALMTRWHLAPDLIDEALANTKSPEVAWRLKRVKAHQNKPDSKDPHTLRVRRAQKVLEVIGTDKAKALLQKTDPNQAKAKAAAKAGSTSDHPTSRPRPAAPDRYPAAHFREP